MRYFTPEEVWVIWLNAATFAAGIVLIGVNSAFFHYTGALYFPVILWPAIIPVGGICLWSMRMKERRPDLAFIGTNMALCAVLIIAQLILLTGMQFTPFPPIDSALARADAAMRFNVIDLMAWTYRHPKFSKAMWACYDSIDVQLLFVPLIACCLQDKRRVNIFLYALAYSTLAGCCFYYFFPSSGPGSIYRSALFSQDQRATYEKFYAVHHFQPVRTLAGGIIAFPSFHVAWGVMLPYLAGVRDWLFYPVLACCIGMILSTLFLGWHFLVDLPAGAALALAGLYVGRFTYERLSSLTERASESRPLGKLVK